MARQLATLFVKRLEVPLVLRDLTDELVDAALADVRSEVGESLATLVSGTTGWDGFEDCDLVLEAVVEELAVKQEGLRDARGLAPNAILASNTSSLSLAEMGADVGLHFFNPVAVLPLVEIVRHDDTSDEAVATAWDVVQEAAQARRRDEGRARLRRQSCAHANDERAHGLARARQHRRGDRRGDRRARDADGAVRPAAARRPARRQPRARDDARGLSRPLPALPDAREPRGREGRGRPRRRPPPDSTEEITDAVLEALADEIGRLLDEGVVGSAQDVDTCLLLGAGWPVSSSAGSRRTWTRPASPSECWGGPWRTQARPPWAFSPPRGVHRFVYAVSASPESGSEPGRTL